MAAGFGGFGPRILTRHQATQAVTIVTQDLYDHQCQRVSHAMVRLSGAIAPRRTPASGIVAAAVQFGVPDAQFAAARAQGATVHLIVLQGTGLACSLAITPSADAKEAVDAEK